jgi:hypothetical protein
MAGVKLTKAQRELLELLPCSAVQSYKPAIALVEHGFAEWAEGRFYAILLRPTDAGKAFLTNQPAQAGDAAQVVGESSREDPLPTQSSEAKADG